MAETCDSFCTSHGRGHMHYVKCDPNICGSALHDGARHCGHKFPGNIVHQLDMYTHEFHWQHMGFEDPVKTQEDKEAFRKCGNFCQCEEHRQVRPQLSGGHPHEFILYRSMRLWQVWQVPSHSFGRPSAPVKAACTNCQRCC